MTPAETLRADALIHDWRRLTPPDVPRPSSGRPCWSSSGRLIVTTGEDPDRLIADLRAWLQAWRANRPAVN